MFLLMFHNLADMLSIIKRYDSITLILWLSLVVFGIVNIYSTEYLHSNSLWLKQCLWFGVSLLCFFLMTFIDGKLYIKLAYIIFFFSILIMIFTLLLGHGVRGHRSWIKFGQVYIQPSEFLKLTCSLAISRKLNNCKISFSLKDRMHQLIILFTSVGSVLLQNDFGSAFTFLSFFLLFFIYGLSVVIILLMFYFLVLLLLVVIFPTNVILVSVCFCGCVTMFLLDNRIKFILFFVTTLSAIFFCDYVKNNVFKPYHVDRIRGVFSNDKDKLGKKWNILQSKIAIGSGGMMGKGFLNGTQTKYGFLPSRSTDFIFCSICEEFGFVGVAVLILVYLLLLFRLNLIAERQKYRFAQVFAYCTLCVIFFCFLTNISMVVGLFPIIGIPLPFISYGGSSLLSLSIMIFITLYFDSLRNDTII